MIKLFLVCLFCGLGAVVRFLLTRYNAKAAFPWGTFIGNMLAAFLIGFFYDKVANTALYSILAAGLLGGLGTYSTLNYEFVQLFANKKVFVFYFVSTYLLGLILVFLGILI